MNLRERVQEKNLNIEVHPALTNAILRFFYTVVNLYKKYSEKYWLLKTTPLPLFIFLSDTCF